MLQGLHHPLVDFRVDKVDALDDVGRDARRVGEEVLKCRLLPPLMRPQVRLGRTRQFTRSDVRLDRLSAHLDYMLPDRRPPLVTAHNLSDVFVGVWAPPARPALRKVPQGVHVTCEGYGFFVSSDSVLRRVTNVIMSTMSASSEAMSRALSAGRAPLPSGQENDSMTGCPPLTPST